MSFVFGVGRGILIEEKWVGDFFCVFLIYMLKIGWMYFLEGGVVVFEVTYWFCKSAGWFLWFFILGFGIWRIGRRNDCFLYNVRYFCGKIFVLF